MENKNFSTAKNFLLSELPKPQTKEQLLKITGWVLENIQRSDALVQLFLSGNYRITQRAVRIISLISDTRPELVQPYLPHIIAALKSNPTDAVKRNVMRLLQVVELPHELLGQMAELCFTYIANPKEAIAVRAFSISVLARICHLKPELSREFLLLIDDILPFASPEITVRIREAGKLLKAQ